jgi:hypothetical protein
VRILINPRRTLGRHRQHVEQQPADGIGRIMDRSTEIKPDATLRQLGVDIPRVRQRPGQPVQPVQLRDHQRVTLRAHIRSVRRDPRSRSAVRSRRAAYRLTSRNGNFLGRV